ncbi:tetratricopeptide repeat protein [Dongia deserti]|uniref:tetratricopeptide repeat protein n=1 Tax=Dongia deserti TaxID=2268030 RepID=UPI000E64FE8A|nr:tetratricopeptide repeat protein [Dongia deserti]
MERPRHEIGLDVQNIDLMRRQPRACQKWVLPGFAAILVTLAVTACEPDQPAGGQVADAQGTIGGQSSSSPGESWTTTGAYLAGMTAFQQRDMKVAADLLTRALGKDFGNAVLSQKTLVALMSDGRIDDAIELAGQMKDAGIKSTLVTLVLMQAEARTGDYEDALTVSRDLPGDRLMQVTAPMLRAWLALGAAEKEEAALAELKPLQEIEGATMLWQMQSALISDYVGDNKKADANLLAAIDASVTIPAQLAEFYVTLKLREGDEKAARAMVERYQEQAEGRGEDVATAMDRQLGQPKPKGPLVADIKRGLAIAYSQIAMELMADDYNGDALWLTRLALDLDPKLDIAALALGDLQRQVGHLDQAIVAYGQVPETSIFRRPAQLSVAECYRRQEKFSDAESLLRKLMNENETDISAAQQLGQLLRSNKKFEEAAKVYGVAIDRLGKLEPEDWQLFYYRGISYERAKQWPTAEKDFEKALELSPDEPYVLNYLAYTWVERRENLKQAFEMLEKAVSQRPEEGFIIDSLGWAHYMLGRYPDAVTELERAVSLAPTDPVLNDHLGDAYWMVGRKQEARFQWTRALSFDPEPDLAPKLQQKLEQGLTASGELPPETQKVKSQAGNTESGG